jgi:hypothetical protein
MASTMCVARGMQRRPSHNPRQRELDSSCCARAWHKARAQVAYKERRNKQNTLAKPKSCKAEAQPVRLTPGLQARLTVLNNPLLQLLDACIK